MFPFDRALSGWLGIGWLVGLALIVFLVTWLATDIGGLKRAPYIAILGVVTTVAAGMYLAWAKVGTRFWSYHWAWGLVGTAVVSGVMMLFARQLPRRPRHAGAWTTILWEGVLYGAAEGTLLSLLPVAIAWQIARSFGWTSWAAVLFAIIASVVVVTIHHLGYVEFRGSRMRYAVVGCTPLAIAYVLTGNPMAPVVGHIVLHVAMGARGVIMPPHAAEEWSEEQSVEKAA